MAPRGAPQANAADQALPHSRDDEGELGVELGVELGASSMPQQHGENTETVDQIASHYSQVLETMISALETHYAALLKHGGVTPAEQTHLEGFKQYLQSLLTTQPVIEDIVTTMIDISGKLSDLKNEGTTLYLSSDKDEATDTPPSSLNTREVGLIGLFQRVVLITTEKQADDHSTIGAYSNTQDLFKALENFCIHHRRVLREKVRVYHEQQQERGLAALVAGGNSPLSSDDESSSSDDDAQPKQQHAMLR